MGPRDSGAGYSALAVGLYPVKPAVVVVLGLAHYGSEGYCLGRLIPFLVLLLGDPDVYQQSLLRVWRVPRKS